MSLTDIANERAEEVSRGGSLDRDDYERYDVSNGAFVKMHPGPVAVGGTAKVLRRFPGDPDDPEDDDYAGLVVTDPFLHNVDEDTENLAIFQSNQDKGDDYKVVNMDDEGVDTLEGVGLEYDDGQRVFKSEQVEEFEEDEIILKLTGNAGRSVAACLDVHGSGAADVERDENGEPILNDAGNPQINGDPLLEYPPDDVDEYRAQYYRDTELRPDFEGEEVVFLLQRRKNVPSQPDDAGGHWATVLGKNEDGNWVTVEPTDEFEPEDLTTFATGWFEWNYPSEEEVERLRSKQGVNAE